VVRHSAVVGERERCSEAEPKGDVERRSVRMQTRVAINQIRILVAVNPRFPGPGSSSQETLGLRRPEFSSGLSLLVSAFSLNGAPRPLSVLLHCTVHALLPQQVGEPTCYPRLRYVIYRQSFSAQNHSMSQLLRTV